ncbi:MAG: DUF1851 domain-containing protein [Woeseiaceae bacterium]|nr:DUF1851 domain-containing protein [Woeseiaceae bacterium]
MPEISLFASPSNEDVERALGYWPSLSGPLKPHVVSAFGDIFFQRTDGSIHRLDPLEGSVSVAASSIDQFNELLDDKDWLEANLMPDFLSVAAERGVTREPHQVFAFAPHPAFTGQLRIDQLKPMDLPVWHMISSQLFVGD